MNAKQNQDHILNVQDAMNRRTFLTTASSLGLAAVASLLGEQGYAAPAPPSASGLKSTGGLPGLPHFPAKAKRVLYLFQSGAPSQMDLFDYKPQLAEKRGEDLPSSVRNGQRLTGMTSGQKTFPVAPTLFKFAQYGKSGLWLSELLPHMSSMADEMCVIKSMNTEAINHDPAVTFFHAVGFSC